jgi:hypothetical protein
MRVWPFVLLGLAVLLCGGGIGGIFIFSRFYRPAASQDRQGSTSPPMSPAARPSPTSDSGSSDGRITLENYNKLKPGMSREDVDALLGSGQQVSSSSGGGHTFTVDTWIDDDFNSIILTFDNDKLSSKAQSGLK